MTSKLSEPRAARIVILYHCHTQSIRILSSLAACLFFFLLSGCDEDPLSASQIPFVTTTELIKITTSELICESVVSNFGESSITRAGVCWSESPEPTILDYQTSDEINSNGAFLSIISDLEEGKNYYLRAYAENSKGIAYSSVVTFNTLSEIEQQLIKSIYNISDTSATLSINIANINPESIRISFEFGPTRNYGSEIMLTETSTDKSGNEQLSACITNLNSGTSYHYRLKVQNASKTIYDDDGTFNTLVKDNEGNYYHIIKIGEQTWLKENLRTSRFNNGELIGTTPTYSADITGENTPHYQWECTNVEHGRYYTYYTITDSRGICPAGWHVPTDEEWTTLTDYLSTNNYGFEGDSLKISKSLAAQSGWEANTMPGTVGNDQESNNKSSFTGLASGGRHNTGEIAFVGHHGIWWSSNESPDGEAIFRCIGYVPGRIYRGLFDKAYGVPVRCLKDE